MDNSLVGKISHEIVELGKDTAKEIVKQTKMTGKEFFCAMIGLDEIKPMTDEELMKRKRNEENERQILLQQQRRMLKYLAAAHHEEEERPYEHTMREEVYKEQRKVELAKQKQKMKLPKIGSPSVRGSAFAYKKRKKQHVELGKTPGQ